MHKRMRNSLSGSAVAACLAVACLGSSSEGTAGGPEVGGRVAATDPRSVADRPRGIFVLGSTDIANEIASLDYVEGVTVRLDWEGSNPSAGWYDFSEVDAVLAALRLGGKKMNLEAFAVEVPGWLLSRIPASEQWDSHAPGRTTVRTAVPWSDAAQIAWRDFMIALADHLVPLPDGRAVRFAEHPSLMMVDAPIVGLQGVRDLTKTMTTLPGYSRSAFINAVVRSVHAARDAFSEKHGFLAFFRMNDADVAHPLDQELMNRLMDEFNNAGQPSLGFFQENLSDAGPTAEGLGALLASVKDRTYIVFQALTAWVRPFTGENNVKSGRAAVGIEFAYRTYGTTYVELYIADVRDPAQTGDLRAWNAILKG